MTFIVPKCEWIKQVDSGCWTHTSPSTCQQSTQDLGTSLLEEADWKMTDKKKYLTVAERLFRIENGKVLYERMIPLKEAEGN